ncbi:MAG: hypothetical protein ACKO8T_10465 [Actinomycetota bacterium]
MSTRKLILTALLCGLAILIAGGIKLIQVANDEKQVEVLALGDEVTLGDMTVSVLDIDRRPDATLVTVTMTGVDLASGAANGWRLLADGRVREAVESDDPRACRAVTATESTKCTVRFDSAESAPTVAYVRAGEQRQWAAGTP